MVDNYRDDIIEQALQRLIGGDELDAILRDYPDRADELRAALAPAVALLSATIPQPSPAARLAAQHRLTSELRTQQAVAPRAIGIVAWLSAMRARPIAVQALAGVAAFAVFSGVGIGAAAATGNTPQPIRSILRISSDSATRVQFTGTISGIDTAAQTITIALADGSVRTIAITAATQISGEQGAIAFDALRLGDTVDVTMVQHTDGNTMATHVAVGAPVASSAPGTATAANSGGDGTATSGADDATERPGATTEPSSSESPGAGREPTEASDGRGGAQTPGREDGTPGSASTTTPGGKDASPEPTHRSDNSGGPDPTHGAGDGGHTPEPTEKPQATEQPQPTEHANATEPPDSEGAARTPSPSSGQ